MTPAQVAAILPPLTSAQAAKVATLLTIAGRPPVPKTAPRS